jgi:hypothetical protein
MAEVRTYKATNTQYRKNSGTWWAPFSGGNVASGWVDDANEYDARHVFNWDAIRSKNATHRITALKLCIYRTDSNNATGRRQYVRTANSSYGSLVSGTYADVTRGSWFEISLPQTYIDSILSSSCAYLGTYNTNATYSYIEYGAYNNSDGYVPYLEITWEVRDTSSKTSIYSGAASQATSPTITHAVKFSAVRNVGTITLVVEFTATLAAGQSLGAGRSLYVYANCPDYADSSTGYTILKETNEVWNASDGTTRSAVLTVTVPSVNGANSISLKTGTARSDSGLQGVHERTNTIAVPAAPAPSVGISVHYGGAEIRTIACASVVSWVALNGNGGSTAISSYTYQYTTDGVNWYAHTSVASASTTLRPSDRGIYNGVQFSLRIMITNAWGQTAYSPVVVMTNISTPATPGTVATNKNVVANSGDAIALSCVTAQGADHTIDGHQILYRLSGGAWTLLEEVVSNDLTFSRATTQRAVARGAVVEYAFKSRATLAGGTIYSYQSAAVTVKTAVLPTTPGKPVGTPVSVAPAETQAIAFAKSVADALTAMNAQYLESAQYNGSAWSAWVDAGIVLTAGATNVTGNFVPITKFPAIRAGHKVKYRARALDNLGLYSSYSTESDEYTIKAGRVYHKVNGAYVLGETYFKTAGAWKLAASLYYKTAGAWREAV